MVTFTAPPRPATWAESRLIDAILEGRFPIASSLPAERELAVQLGITRPTLREVLQRLERDGWIDIHHGRSTRVRDFWRDGNLAVLNAIAHRSEHLPPNFISNLLAVRLLIAPAYTRQAVACAPQEILNRLAAYGDLPDAAETYARADWELHHALTVASGNPIFTLILNGFAELYPLMARRYFARSETRNHSRSFYNALAEAARAGDAVSAETLTRQVMQDSLLLWETIPG